MSREYRRFVPNFARIARSLNVLTSTHLANELPPSVEETQAAFEALRNCLLKPPTLAIRRERSHYFLEVDASYERLGCALLQRQQDGAYISVGHFSRGSSPAERN